MRRIVIMGDLYRYRPIVEANTMKLWNLIREPVKAATGVEPVRYHKTVGKPWHSNYDTKPPAPLLRTLTPFRDALVITFEASPTMWRAFAALDIKAIDINVHPIRFLPDLMLGFRSNDPEISAAIGYSKYATSGWHSSLTSPAVSSLQGSVVFFTQCARDRALIHGGRFLRWKDISQTVLYQVAERPLFIKPHPYQPANEFVAGLQSIGGTVIDTPTYTLLGSLTKFDVMTVNSSVAAEARAFGHQPFTFLPLPVTGTAITHGFFESEFWCTLLGLPVNRTVTKTRVDNELRNVFAWWSKESPL